MNIKKKLLIVYPILFVLIFGGIFTLMTEYSYAAESFDVSSGTKWVQGQNIDSGLRIKTKDGTIAYCLNQGSASPSGTYTDKLTLSSKLKAVLYYGYPNNKTFGNTTLTGDQARCATQLAVWAHDNSGKGNKIDLGELHGAYDKVPDGDNVLKAAKWLYNKANSGYTAPTKPTLPSPQLTKPTNNTPQYFNSTYVRVGPYKFTTTNNSYTSNNKVTVNLNNAPAGTRIGNAAGTFISTPTAGTDFYLYLPSEKLTEKGSGSFDISISYDYKYEKAATFTAYKKSSTQDVAVSTEKEYTTGSNKTNATGNFGWTISKLTKVDSDDEKKIIPDTEFDIFYDPTPTNSSNNDWILMYKMKTDQNGVIKIPGLGVGTYKLVETKPNPDYAFNSEFGGSDEIIFKVTDVNTESIQVMTNNIINVSCQVDKDTIKKTSAAYKSLPDQEGFDNTNIEAYRYYIDYRSTANVWADEFTMDDPLEGVSNGQFRVTELWTPICHGDYDGKMNLWYKTNKTDDNTDYSDVNAVSSNPVNPNNPAKEFVKKNTGYKLWMKDISTTERSNLKVEELNLDDDEYITSIRIEHGKVEKGFTTRNYVYESLNDDKVIDWTPKESDQFYTKESADAKGLKPLTYLVVCPNPLYPPEVINNSADVFIARNIHLTDDDKDEVFTEVIDTFKEGPVDEKVKGDTDILGESRKKGGESKTADMFKYGLALISILGALLVLTVASAVKKKNKNKTRMLSVLLAGMLLTGVFAATNDSYAASRPAEDRFVKNGVEYSMVKINKALFDRGEETYKVKYEVNQNINAAKFDTEGSRNILPKNLEINVDGYNGKITQDKKSVKPLYIKKQAQVDKKEIIKQLSIEDISKLPESKIYTIRSDKAADATVDKELKRAGVSLKVSGYDEDGIPNLWDATIVYRGLETYLEKYQYDVKATYSGNIGKDSGEVRTVASADEKDYGELTEKEARDRNEKLAKEKYMQIKGYETPKTTPKSAKPESEGWKTGDIVKFLGLLAALALISFLIFTFITQKKKKQI